MKTWVVVDCAGATDARAMQEYMNAHKADKNIVYFVVTHPHHDHLSGFRSLISSFTGNTAFEIKEFLQSRTFLPEREVDIRQGRTHNSQEAALLDELLLDLNSTGYLNRVEIMRRRDPIMSIENDTFLYCVWPDYETSKTVQRRLERFAANPDDGFGYLDIHDACLVLFFDICTGGKEHLRIFLFGDANASAQLASLDFLRNLIKDGMVENIVKLSHHGSFEANPKEILGNIVAGKNGSTRAIITTSGKYRDHPHPDVLLYLYQSGARVYCTRYHRCCSTGKCGRRFSSSKRFPHGGTWGVDSLGQFIFNPFVLDPTTRITVTIDCHSGRIETNRVCHDEERRYQCELR